MGKFNFDSIFPNKSNEKSKPTNKEIPDIHINNIGDFKFDNDSEWYLGPNLLLELPNKSNKKLVLVLTDDYKEYESVIYESIDYLKNNCVSIFRSAEKYIFQYYKNTVKMFGNGINIPVIKKENELWDNISLGNEAIINLRSDNNKIYISLECECTWEEEHGLQIVIKEGKKINKIGQYDGHLTNSDAYAKDELEDIIYYS